MRTLSILTLLCVTAAPLLADAPKQPRLMHYARLWAPSPFTIKPAPKPIEQISPLERDWTLGSISPGEKGYWVTLINKKDRKDRIRFIPGVATNGFQLIEVKTDPTSSKNSRVHIRKGSQTAWIGYDEKFVKPRVAAVRTTKPGSSNGRTSPPRPGSPTKPSSSKRPRYIPRKK